MLNLQSPIYLFPFFTNRFSPGNSLQIQERLTAVSLKTVDLPVGTGSNFFFFTVKESSSKECSLLHLHRDQLQVRSVSKKKLLQNQDCG